MNNTTVVRYGFVDVDRGPGIASEFQRTREGEYVHWVAYKQLFDEHQELERRFKRAEQEIESLRNSHDNLWAEYSYEREENTRLREIQRSIQETYG